MKLADEDTVDLAIAMHVADLRDDDAGVDAALAGCDDTTQLVHALLMLLRHWVTTEDEGAWTAERAREVSADLVELYRERYRGRAGWPTDPTS